MRYCPTLLMTLHDILSNLGPAALRLTVKVVNTSAHQCGHSEQVTTIFSQDWASQLLNWSILQLYALSQQDGPDHSRDVCEAVFTRVSKAELLTSVSLLTKQKKRSTEPVIYQKSEGQWFDPQLLCSTFQGVLEQDTEPQTAADGGTTGVWMCVYEFLKSRLALCREVTCPFHGF